MAVAAWALGAAFLLLARARTAVAGAIGARRGPARAAPLVRRGAAGAQRATRTGSTTRRSATCATASRRCSSPPACSSRSAFAFTPTRGSFAVGSVATEDLPIIVLLVLCVVAAFTVVRDPGRLRPVLALSVLGFALAAVYAVAGAPDVALVAVLVETIFTLVFVGVFSRLPQPRRRARAAGAAGPAQPAGRHRRGRRVVRRDLGDALADEPGDAATRPSRSRGRARRTAATSSR